MAFNQNQTTDATGLATFTDVPVGTGYTLSQSESTVPSGYVRFVDTDFEVTEGMSTTAVTLAPDTGNDLSLTATVLDAAGTGDPVPGSVFNVYADVAKTMLLDQFTSEAGTGAFIVPHLVGATGGRNYYISQVSAASGHAMSEDVTVSVVIYTTPTAITIINPVTTDVPVSAQDSNYSNIVFEDIDLTLSHS